MGFGPHGVVLKIRLGDLQVIRHEVVELGCLWRTTGDLDRDCFRWVYRNQDLFLDIDPYVFDIPAYGEATSLGLTDLMLSPVRRFAEYQGGTTSWAIRVMMAIFLGLQIEELELVSAVEPETWELLNQNWRKP